MAKWGDSPVVSRSNSDRLLQALPMTKTDRIQKTPLVLWAQRTDKLIVTLEIQDAQQGTLQATETSIKYRCQSASENADFEVELVFYDAIEPSAIVEHASGHGIEFVIPKANKMEKYWPRLLKTTDKYPFIKTDFNKWKDEEDEDEDEDGNAMNPYADFASDFEPSELGADNDYYGDVTGDQKDDDDGHDDGHHEHKHDGSCCH